MDIQINITQTKGAAEAMDNGVKAGEMTFSIADNDLIIIDHTEVNPDYRGKGIGDQLLEKVVDWARKENYKIMPLCPFANARFKKNPEIQDVLKK